MKIIWPSFCSHPGKNNKHATAFLSLLETGEGGWRGNPSRGVWPRIRQGYKSKGVNHICLEAQGRCHRGPRERLIGTALQELQNGLLQINPGRSTGPRVLGIPDWEQPALVLLPPPKPKPPCNARPSRRRSIPRTQQSKS